MVDNLRYRASPDDYRDLIYVPKNNPLPNKVDLREWDSLVEDQLYLGSCSGQAVSNAYELMIKKLYPQSFVELSELFIYYNARTFDDTTESDSGATLRNALKGLQRWGVCTDDLWKYDTEKFNVKPTPECYADAEPRKIPVYQRVTSVGSAMDALSVGHPVVIGTPVYNTFDYLDEYDYVMTARGFVTGYHAMTIVGYDTSGKYFIVKNSYGTGWGLKGYCYMPFTYMDNYVFESWVFNPADLSSKLL